MTKIATVECGECGLKYIPTLPIDEDARCACGSQDRIVHVEGSTSV
jgi:hypothetical protein